MSDYPIQGFPDNLRAQSVTIAAGAAVSEMFATQGYAICLLVIPAGWTAAAVGFKGCVTGNSSDLQTVYDSGGNPEGTPNNVNASSLVAFPAQDSIFVPFMQLVSVSATDRVTPVNQTSARTVIVLLRKLFS